MTLNILLPTRVLLDETVATVTAEAPDGQFCLRPRHIDLATVLVPGILSWRSPEGRDAYAAVDRGTLVKCGDRVSVSVLDAAAGSDPDDLKRIVADHFNARSEREKTVQAAMARIEAGFVRRFIEIHAHR